LLLMREELDPIGRRYAGSTACNDDHRNNMRFRRVRNLSAVAVFRRANGNEPISSDRSLSLHERCLQRSQAAVTTTLVSRPLHPG
jgi:hypothetical protein